MTKGTVTAFCPYCGRQTEHRTGRPDFWPNFHESFIVKKYTCRDCGTVTIRKRGDIIDKKGK